LVPRLHPSEEMGLRFADFWERLRYAMDGMVPIDLRETVEWSVLRWVPFLPWIHEHLGLEPADVTTVRPITPTIDLDSIHPMEMLVDALRCGDPSLDACFRSVATRTAIFLSWWHFGVMNVLERNVQMLEERP